MAEQARSVEREGLHPRSPVDEGQMALGLSDLRPPVSSSAEGRGEIPVPNMSDRPSRRAREGH